MSKITLKDFSKLGIHTITTKPWSVEKAIKQYAISGIKGITVWRQALENRKLREIGRMILEHGLDLVSLCRGGFFAAKDTAKRKRAIEENMIIIDEAAEIEAPTIVLVCGADPDQSLEESRKQIREGIETILPRAVAAGINLAVEPLHPMYADNRSAINTLKQANDLCKAIDSPNIGVTIDVYHLWWDPDLREELIRCGKMKKIFAFHICDWKTPTLDLLYDRGLMGEGCIPIHKLRKWTENAGFNGYHEVEIFSHTYWQTDQTSFLNQIKSAYLKSI